MKTKLTVTLGILVAGLLIATFASAQKGENKNERRGYKNHGGECREDGPREGGDRAGHRRGSKGRFGKKMMQHLNLTAEQQAKLDNINAEKKESTEPIRTELKQLHEKMRAEWMKQKPSKTDILALHYKINELNKRLAEQRISSRLDMIGILTPAQRTQMIELTAERGKSEARGERRHKGNRNVRDLNKHSRKNASKTDMPRRNS